MHVYQESTLGVAGGGATWTIGVASGSIPTPPIKEAIQL
jgi:hypothetical protein